MFVGCSCRTPEAVEFPQVQFSDKASIGLCAIPGVNIETSWVMSVWLLALSVLRVNVRGLSCTTPKAVETSQVQFSDKSVLDRALFLERILRRVGSRMAFGALNVVSHYLWDVV